MLVFHSSLCKKTDFRVTDWNVSLLELEAVRESYDELTITNHFIKK